MRKHSIDISVGILALTMALAACSTTSGVPEGDRLYTGIDKITYTNYEKNDHFYATQEEVEAALACPPNGSLFGSSSYRSPFPLSLWIWNAYSDKETKFAEWMTKSFGKAPVLMSNVNPELRASVAQSTLNVHGYFQGKVNSYEVKGKNPKKGKVGYNIDMGHLYTIDSVRYEHFGPEAQALIDSTSHESYLGKDVPFDVSTLDAERSRISTLFRNNGYFYYQPGYASYLADTFAVPGKVWVRLQLADSLPDRVMRKWYLGEVEVNLRKTRREELNNTMADYAKSRREKLEAKGKTVRRRSNGTDRTNRRRMIVNFRGRKPPIRMSVLSKDMKLRPGQVYNYSDYVESANRLSSNGLFSSVDFNFTQRDSTDTCDTLDLSVNCVFDKPYDVYLETNLKGKTTGFLGPQLILGLTKRNAFHGGENLDINLHGSYEWQTGHTFDGSANEINSYEYGGDVSLDYPRIVLPWRVRRRFFSTPTTSFKVSSDIVNRSGYFKRHIVSGEVTYKYQFRNYWMHQFTPLSVEYNYLKRGTDRFYDLLGEHPYLLTIMLDQFIPKMKYVLTFSNASRSRNPVFWQTSISESGNLSSVAYMAFGKKWDEKNKKLLKNPYAQFFKIETDFTKTWSVSDHTQLVGHLSAGYAWAFGNSESIPYTEQFWVGGANSIRAFNVRSIGPGKYHSEERQWRFIEQVGDIKLQANLEYRPRIIGNLYGALFLDAGNVWDSNDYIGGGKLKLSNLWDELALGTGVGIRYDLDYFVIRLDWGFGIHAPYDTGKNGYFNIRSFRDGQSLHFAIGYPF